MENKKDRFRLKIGHFIEIGSIVITPPPAAAKHKHIYIHLYKHPLMYGRGHYRHL